MSDDIAAMTFEAALAELEKVVGQLESAQVPLDQSIDLYDRGAKLKAHCEAQLRAAEEKIEKITLSADGKPTGTAPFDG